MTFTSIVITELTKLTKRIMSAPVRDNLIPLLRDAAMWDAIEAHAKKASAEAWKRLEAAEVYSEDTLREHPGQRDVITSSPFTLIADVTEPVRRFDPNWLASALAHSKHKVPEHYTKELINQAKQPTQSVVRLKIVER